MPSYEINNKGVDWSKFKEAMERILESHSRGIDFKGKLGIMPMPWAGKTMPHFDLKREFDRTAYILSNATKTPIEHCQRAMDQFKGIGLDQFSALSELARMPLPTPIYVVSGCRDMETFNTRLKNVRQLNAISRAQEKISQINFSN